MKKEHEAKDKRLTANGLFFSHLPKALSLKSEVRETAKRLDWILFRLGEIQDSQRKIEEKIEKWQKQQ